MQLATDSKSEIPGRVALRLSWASPGGQGLGENSSRRYIIHSELAPSSSLEGLNCWGLQSRQVAITDIPALGRWE